MKILMPFTRAVGGGSFISAALLAKGLIASGAQVLAVFPNTGPSTEVFRKHAVPLRILDDLPVVAAYKRSLPEAKRYVGDFIGTYRAASRLLAVEEFDFVHLNDGTTVLPWGLAARQRGIRTVWHIRGGNTGYTDRLRMRLSDHRICISNFVATRLPWGSKCHVLYNPAVPSSGLDPQVREGLRGDLCLKVNDIHLIQMGRDAPYKRPSWSIAALIALHEHGCPASLTFLGHFTSDRQKALLEPLPETLRRRVHFTGWIPDPERYLLASDILLHPAGGEHFGRIFVEAATSNVPFIATPTGAVPELIMAGLPGVMSEFDTPSSYSNKVVEFVRERLSMPRERFVAPWWMDPKQNALEFLRLISA